MASHSQRENICNRCNWQRTSMRTTTKKPLQKQHNVKINYWIYDSQKLSDAQLAQDKVLNISRWVPNGTTRKCHCVPAQGETVEQLEGYVTVIILGNSLSISYKGKYMRTLWFIDSTSGDKTKRNAYIHPQ